MAFGLVSLAPHWFLQSLSASTHWRIARCVGFWVLLGVFSSGASMSVKSSGISFPGCAAAVGATGRG